MRAAIVSDLGTTPRATTCDAPTPGADEVLAIMQAVAINPVDVAVAAGTFYAGHPPLPFVPCIEGAALVDGRLVYIQGAGLGLSRSGLAAGLAAVPTGAIVQLPDGVDAGLAAALGTAGLAGWMAVREAEVTPDDIVVVLGATGTVGNVALQAARLASARLVIAVGRSVDKLAAAAPFADATVALGDDFATRLNEACGRPPTVVIDLLWGEPLLATLGVVAPRARVIQVGASAGPTANVPSAAVRGKQLSIIGYSNFGLSRADFTQHYLELLAQAQAGRIDMSVQRFTLDQLEDAWSATVTASAKAVIELQEDDR